MSPITIPMLAFLALTAPMLTGCNETSSTAAENPTEPTTPTWVLVSAPEGAQSVTEAKVSAKEGEQIVLRGRIGGRKEPLTEGSPVFTMMDLSIPHCGENSDGACRTPWDYCCETSESKTENSATVQIMDTHGQPIAEDPTAEGLMALDEVIVVGIVAPRPSKDVLTVRATGIFRVGG